MEKKPKKKPAFEARVGSVRVSIWENQDKQGNVFYSTSVVRRFRVNDEWENSSSYTGLSDLAFLKKAVDLADKWLTNKALDAEGGGGEKAASEEELL